MLLGALLGSAFFLLAPPLNYRFWGHYSLSNQWLLIAALFVFAQAQEPSEKAVRRFVISAAILVAISVGINPYLAFEVLLVLIAGVASLLWQKRDHAGAVRRSRGAAAERLASWSLTPLGLVISGGKGYAAADIAICR